jgi:hypothetical protein
VVVDPTHPAVAEDHIPLEVVVQEAAAAADVKGK